MYVLSVNSSLAAATGCQALELEEQTPESCSIIRITVPEQHYYKAWQAGKITTLPVVKWTVDRRDSPTSRRAVRKASRRAEALNHIYATDKAEPAHTVWFAEEHSMWLPLVKAIARLAGAERNKLAKTEGSTEMIELRTLRRIVRTWIPIIQQLSDGRLEKLASEQTSILQKEIKALQRRMSVAKCLGKRRHREEETLSISVKHGFQSSKLVILKINNLLIFKLKINS